MDKYFEYYSFVPAGEAGALLGLPLLQSAT